jgi:hypothetical protein
VQRYYSKWTAYFIYNLALALTCVFKIFTFRHILWMTGIVSFLWGLAYGGAFLAFNMMADAIDYDQFKSGERREAQYEVFYEFIPKMVEIPGQVIPLMAMAAAGYVPNVYPQSDGVQWTLRLCFSLIPGVFGFAGSALLLLYPDKKGDIIDLVREFNALPRPHRAVADDWEVLAEEGDGETAVVVWRKEGGEWLEDLGASSSSPSSSRTDAAREADAAAAAAAAAAIAINHASAEFAWTPYIRDKVIIDPITMRATRSPDVATNAVGGSHIEWALDHFAAWEVSLALRCIQKLRSESGGVRGSSPAVRVVSTAGASADFGGSQKATVELAPVPVEPSSPPDGEGEGDGEDEDVAPKANASRDEPMDAPATTMKTKCDTWPLIVFPALWLSGLFIIGTLLIAATALDWNLNFKAAELRDRIVYDEYRATPYCAAHRNCSAAMAPPNASVASVGTICPAGFFAPDCAPCPGLRAVSRDGVAGYEGTVCSGHGTCSGSVGAPGFDGTFVWNATQYPRGSPALFYGVCECEGSWAHIKKDAETGVGIAGVSSCDRQTVEPVWWSPMILAVIGFVAFVIMLQLLRFYAAVRIAFDPEVTIAAVKVYADQGALAAAAVKHSRELLATVSATGAKVADGPSDGALAPPRDAALANVYTMREAINCVLVEAEAANAARLAAAAAAHYVESIVDKEQAAVSERLQDCAAEGGEGAAASAAADVAAAAAVMPATAPAAAAAPRDD